MAESPLERAKRETPDGCVRFWSVTNYGGGPGVQKWDYNPKSGYQDAPPGIHDHALSFYSKVHRPVHAVNWFGEGQKETRVIRGGDHRWDWDFGEKLDACQPD
jgi:hypothetical protein